MKSLIFWQDKLKRGSRTFERSMVPEVLHIVVVYNGKAWLPQLVESVQASGTGEVWAIDHGSTDGSWEWLREHLPASNRIQGPNLGFGSGNNRGMEEALRRGVPGVHLLNQDARVDPQGMRVMTDWILQREREGHALEVVSPIHWDWEGKVPYEHFDKRYAPQWREHTVPFEVPFIHAASWLMTLNTVRQVGGFNPAFFMYGEDNEWAHRLKKAGGRFWIHPEGSLFHDEKPKPWPKPTVLERMAFAAEVTAFFEGTATASEWRRSAFRRVAARALHPHRWLDVLTGSMWLGERSAMRRVRENVEAWEAARNAVRHQESPHLIP